mmetsp:Transcript_6190/g.20200  ORF Transcript_6190/g.20200 Transcript_6190/m.20200 type:complete len:826 (-) Transcript_6190:89-2566(-)
MSDEAGLLSLVDGYDFDDILPLCATHIDTITKKIAKTNSFLESLSTVEQSGSAITATFSSSPLAASLSQLSSAIAGPLTTCTTALSSLSLLLPFYSSVHYEQLCAIQAEIDAMEAQGVADRRRTSRGKEGELEADARRLHALTLAQVHWDEALAVLTEATNVILRSLLQVLRAASLVDLALAHGEQRPGDADEANRSALTTLSQLITSVAQTRASADRWFPRHFDLENIRFLHGRVVPNADSGTSGTSSSRVSSCSSSRSRSRAESSAARRRLVVHAADAVFGISTGLSASELARGAHAVHLAPLPTSGTLSLDDLPTPLLLYLASFVEPKSLLHLCCVNKKWLEIAGDVRVWRESLQRHVVGAEEAASDGHLATPRNAWYQGKNSPSTSSRQVRRRSRGYTADEPTSVDRWLAVLEGGEGVSVLRSLAAGPNAAWPGIPSTLRGRVWLVLAVGAGASSEQLQTEYKTLLADRPLDPAVGREIDLDVPRTLPAVAVFGDGNGTAQAALGRVLRAVAIARADIGYCQGMNFVAALLLLYTREANAYAILMAMLQGKVESLTASGDGAPEGAGGDGSHGIDGLFRTGFPALVRHLWIHGRMLYARSPGTADYLREAGVRPEMYAASWFIGLFAGTLDPPAAARVLDALLLHGWHAFHAVAVHLVVAALAPEVQEFEAGGGSRTPRDGRHPLESSLGALSDVGTLAGQGVGLLQAALSASDTAKLYRRLDRKFDTSGVVNIEALQAEVKSTKLFARFRRRRAASSTGAAPPDLATLEAPVPASTSNSAGSRTSRMRDVVMRAKGSTIQATASRRRSQSTSVVPQQLSK